MGRRKIEIQPLTDDRNRTVTFVKRKAGLFKKAHELAVLCQVDLAVIIVGSNKKIYEFSLVDPDELILTYQQKKMKVYELKGPENYGNYVRKHYLHEPLTQGAGGGAYDDELLEELEPSLAHDAKRPKLDPDAKVSQQPIIPYRHLKLDLVGLKLEVPQLLVLTQPPAPQRPVLRVQIPSDAPKEGPDLGKTITAALAAPPGPGAPPGPATGSAPKNLAPPHLNKYPNYTPFRSPDSRKPPVLLPIHAGKSQLLLPLDASAPAPQYYQGQPAVGAQQLPLTILPTPVLNQVFSGAVPGQPGQYQRYGDQQQTPVALKYALGELFPLPLAFYAPQDWPQLPTGITPVTLHPYPPPPGGTSSQGGGPAPPPPPLLALLVGPPLAFPNLATFQNFGRTVQAVQNRDLFPLPLQFSSFNSDKEK